jgi:hypothetical protein
MRGPISGTRGHAGSEDGAERAEQPDGVAEYRHGERGLVLVAALRLHDQLIADELHRADRAVEILVVSELEQFVAAAEPRGQVVEPQDRVVFSGGSIVSVPCTSGVR